MTQDNASEAVPPARKSIERLLLGENSISGTLRLIGYMLAFAVIFGTLFHLAG